MKSILVITVVIFILVLLWAVSIGITYWDAVSRRKLPGIETAAWVALVVLIPGIGFAAYCFTRLLGRALSPREPAMAKPRRVTQLKHEVEPEPRTGTIPAAEFLQPYTTETITTPDWTGVEKKARKFKLSVIAGPNSGETIPLEYLPAKIGRGLDVSIRLDGDQLISRLHAEIYEQTGVLRIRDLNSTHGTKVNEFSISDKSLDPGDQIRVGISVLRVDVWEEAE